MRSMIFVLGLGLWLGLSCPALAGAFDGKWVADIPAQGRCNAPGLMTVVVVDHDLAGEVHRIGGKPQRITGTVDGDGNATFVATGSSPGTMKFDPNHFDATWNNGTCERQAQGDRALDEQQSAALVAERRQHQARYADLINRALADDKTLDFTELRRESVYAEHWNFYDTQAAGLLDQAAAAVKGKDCVTGLEKLDQVIKLDFIIDSAHALKADCLKQTGKPDQARIESDIADGLIHSLMDSSGGARSLMRTLNDGDGATVDSAYVVTTYREEMDVLANRHIQVKYRQTEIRGSNGRLYDRVSGISIRTNGGLDLIPKDIYFDISSFMAGRQSARAAVAVAAAAIH